MKIVISYPTNSVKESNTFLAVTQQHMSTFNRQEKGNGFKINFNLNDELNPNQYCSWFHALAARGLDPLSITFDKPTDIYHLLTSKDVVYFEFQRQIRAIKLQYETEAVPLEVEVLASPGSSEKLIYIDHNDTSSGRQIVDSKSEEKISNASGDKPGSQPSDPTYSIPASSIPTVSIELTQDASSSNENNSQINRRNSIDNPSISLETKRTEKLQKFNENLKLLHQKSIELYHLANHVESSPAFRIYRIALELYNKLEMHMSNYIKNEAISDEDFKNEIRQTINGPLELKVRNDAICPETVDIKYELSQHPQWGVYNILDHILWCIDIYRLVTGTRLSFLSGFQPEYRHQIANLEEEASKLTMV